MTGLQAFIMGILQGATEFLPVSSSAHLKIAKMLFHLQEGEELVVFDLVCHLGTLIALVTFFWKDILRLFTEDRKKIPLFIIALAPLVPFYFLLKPVREFASESNLLGPCLILTGIMLYIGSRFRLKRQDLTPRPVRDVLLIGMLQGAALIPGISRSASTISCAHVLGWEAKEAVRFSFLLAIPTIIGGNIAELLKLSLGSSPKNLSLSWQTCTIGFLTAAVVGFFFVRIAVRFLEKGRLKPFAGYCIFLGAFALFFLRGVHG